MQITLRAARANVAMTQREVAKQLGVTVDTVGNWERGKSFPDALQIRQIENIYHVKYDDIIFLPVKTL
ncbi:helix-turn-helix transcriptional regulator [Colidextribacter sp. 210702-DFI.3.9]|nr:helix-turn-helix transcriptional regulator [Colidextribacter sp. 210702-DFI.3.9]